ncbi:type 2 lanthipeptide synthetase LanM family protein [Janthinobacterium fluminis]|uniref:Type 2 lanthipeptide synthetase LanM family protein n=1 Tax=Janthinobacterium fluminis TaxID=2987524 RepID=A0ABT5K7R6_9BURK|nr:type 2 lanthipeptide synthetase LanM family protein [Janthinobacterium fluminis]MDC8760954.1 type 2 lanthipeptide synthetase LanM family protein [Janthinobacterium fluminis]
MDLHKLAGFYEEHTRLCQTKLQEFCTARKIQLEESYVQAVMPNLLDKLFGVTHKVLIAQYKAIAATVSFDDFCDSLLEPEVRAFFHSRYPVMRRWMDTLTMTWVEQSCELLARFIDDRAAIQRDIFRSDDAAEIRHIQFGMGDAHRGGRSVARIELCDGRKLIYKPRSLRIDLHFAALVQWLNQHGKLDLQVPVALDRGNYGWVEFIHHEECASPAQVEGFYERLGAWLALLYVLEGSDFHYENIIASGAQPVLIDLESFFHPQMPSANGESNNNFDDSVLRTGILPSRIDLDAAHLPDISGIADAEGKEGVVNSLFMVRGEDGAIHFERKKGTLQGALNVPRLHGEKIALGAAHITALKQGFQHMYATILTRREELHARLDAFKGDEVRVLFRNTVAYAHLLEEATHPTLMRSEAALNAHFNLLALAIADCPLAERFIPFETSDLQQRDVPLFTTTADGRHLQYAEDGRIPDFFENSGLARVRRKLELLSEHDMKHQAWVIEKTLLMSEKLNAPKTTTGDAPTRGDYSTEERLNARLLQEAHKVGDYIASQVHVDGDRASWMIVKATSLDNRKMELIPAFYDLYCGMPGEILYLSQLSLLSGEPKYRDLADKALHTLQCKLAQARNTIRPLGLFVGWGGVIHLFCSLAVMDGGRDANRHFAEIERLFDSVDFAELIAADRAYSLLKGAAGLMLACADYHIASGSPRALQLARQAAEHLLANRQQDYPGYSWLITSSVPLAGLAHGASGFSLAFARMYSATQEPQYLHACHEALTYERTLFVPEQQNWRDCRELANKMAPGQIVCVNAWAHGAPGIGLARLALLQAGIGGAEIQNELEIAVHTTLMHGFTGNHSLIFGSFGNLELLLSCGQYVDPALAQRCSEILPRLMQELDVHGWQLGEKNFQPLGMMVGVTGIGYQCLRFAFPDRMPSLLSGMSGPQLNTAAQRKIA